MSDERNETVMEPSSAYESLQRWASSTTRKDFLKGAAIAGVSATGLGVLAPTALADWRHGQRPGWGGHGQGGYGQNPPPPGHGQQGNPTQCDLEILGAAEIAEALAVTTYTNIINTSPFFKGLETSTQEYLTAARQEEMSHYLLEESVTGKPAAYTTFYFPTNMFADAQTTLDVLVSLEEAFIAAYLIGVRDFSTGDLKVTAARIMGVEAEHRTLARVIGPEVPSSDGGPIETITGIQKTPESVNPANNDGYERTLLLTSIKGAVEALEPFAVKSVAEKEGFDVSMPYAFTPFTPTLPSALGEFHSFAG
jgi:hypothetical protein